MARNPGTAAAPRFRARLPYRVSITWAVHWWTKRPTRSRWRESYLIAWSWKSAWSPWMPYTPRMKPPAPWSWNTGPIICSRSRATNPPCAHRSKHSSPLRRAIFPPLESTPTKARVQEINKRRQESRSICTVPVTGEQVCFPLAEQAALLLRQTEGRKDELVALITSVEPSRLDATNWLRLNRDHWGIESGLHQRLDISHNDDRCRVRNDNGMLVLGMMLRLSNNLFIQWSGYKRRPDHVTTSDFQSALSEDHHRPALRLALSKHPNLKRLS